MLKKITLACTLAAMAAFSGLAQGTGTTAPAPGTPPDPQTMIQMRVNMLTTLLGLTDTQKTSATTIFTNEITASESVRTTLDTNHESLAAAVKANDTAKIDALATALGTATGQLAAIRAKADALFYSLLTTDQQAKYDAMPHGGPGFGGPGPGGPGPGAIGASGFGAARMRGSLRQ